VPHDLKQQTKCVNSGIGDDAAYGAVTPPLYLSSTYKFPGFGDMGKYDYGRGGNPNRDALADALTALEGGAGAVVTSSGMAAIDLVLNLVPRGGLVLAPHDCYGGTFRLLLSRQEQGRFKVAFINQTTPDAPDTIRSQNPDLILIETPSNPLMRVSDIAALSQAAHDAGALAVCDNTFLSPARQTPLALDADIALHSTTKFINGHSDVVGGAVISGTQDLAEKLAWWANCTGVTGAPFDAYQTLRGLRTLHARMDVQEKNARQIVDFLHQQDLVKRVYYPQNALAQKQQSGPGAMLSFELKTAPEHLQSFFKDAGILQFAESLGGTESLICHPATMTHRAMSTDDRETAGISQTLVRMSVGMEHQDDLILALSRMFSNLNSTE